LTQLKLQTFLVDKEGVAFSTFPFVCMSQLLLTMGASHLGG
jgi:hypothetical protein